jgi:hypothetical protein
MSHNALKQLPFLSLYMTIFLLLPPFIIDADPLTPTTPAQTHIIFNPIISNQPTAVASATASSFTNMSVKMYEAVKDTLTYNNYQDAKNALKKIAWENRYRIGFITAGTAYITVAGMLLYDYALVNDKSAWCNWKSDTSIIELYNKDQKILENELLRAITEHYYDAHNPTIITQPLATFLSAIDAEINTFNRYISLATTIEKIRLIKIFPTNSKKIETAQRLLERTHFIKRIFLSWLSDYALQKQ